MKPIVVDRTSFAQAWSLAVIDLTNRVAEASSDWKINPTDGVTPATCDAGACQRRRVADLLSTTRK